MADCLSYSCPIICLLPVSLSYVPSACASMVPTKAPSPSGPLSLAMVVTSSQERGRFFPGHVGGPQAFQQQLKPGILFSRQQLFRSLRFVLFPPTRVRVASGSGRTPIIQNRPGWDGNPRSNSALGEVCHCKAAKEQSPEFSKPGGS